tara:strand:+ start:97561 stop:99309 length:1749 start_codon:yes stop_codon:yes gene_type:complete
MKWISWKAALYSGIGLIISAATLATLEPASAEERSPFDSQLTSNQEHGDLLAQGGNRGKSSGGDSQSRGSGNRSGGDSKSRDSGNRSGGDSKSRDSGNRSGGNRQGGIHAPAPSRQSGSGGRQQSSGSRSPSFSHPNLNQRPNAGRQPGGNNGPSNNRPGNNILNDLSRGNINGIQRGVNAGIRNNAPRGAWSHPGHLNAQHSNRQFSGNSFNYGNRNFSLGHNTYRPAYYRHSGYHGYWNNNRGFGTGYYGYGSGYGYGNRYGYRPLGWGLGGWGLGTLLYNSGYLGYSNPYYVNSGTTIYNYSQPIPVSSVLVENDVNSTDEVMNNAVAAFQQEDYNASLDIINQGIARYPDDAVFHEFRALVLFARGDYQQAAATIHSVLAVGPGWDWTTLSSFYLDVDTYTAQLRALEAAPQDAATRFLQAYQYLCCGHAEAAAEQLRIVVQLKPNDRVAVDMLKMLAPPQPDSQTTPAPQPTPASNQASVTSINPETLVGTWQATRPDGSQFDLTLTKQAKFNWSFTPKNQPAQKFDGTYTVEKNVLALEGETVGSLIGEVTPGSGKSFNFKVLGAPSDDPGLNFKQ